MYSVYYCKIRSECPLLHLLLSKSAGKLSTCNASKDFWLLASFCTLFLDLSRQKITTELKMSRICMINNTSDSDKRNMSRIAMRPTKSQVRPAMTDISLGFRLVCS